MSPTSGLSLALEGPIHPPEDLSHCLFIVWPDAFDFVDRIRDDLSQDFRILADVRLQWSQQHVQNNLRRLYRQPVLSEPDATFISPKASKPFLHVFYVESSSNEIALHASATLEIERINPAFANKKDIYRQWIVDSGVEYPFLVHSAARLDELRLQTVLLFGTEQASALWAGQPLGMAELKRDVTGAAGWASLREAFDALDHSIDWCVLRGWEDLPDHFSSNDLDILVDNPKSASSALGLLHNLEGSNIRSGLMRLSDQDIKCDLHWTGDGYLDAVWENHLLSNRVKESNVFRPNSEDAFFSLIYSEYVHRHQERPEKIDRILRVSQELSHTGWLTSDLFKDRQKVLKTLAGYMKIQGYFWVPPVAERYAQAEDAVAALPKPDAQYLFIKKPVFFRIGARIAHRILPINLRKTIGQKVRKMIKI